MSASKQAGGLPKRSALRENQRWNIESVYASVEDWEADHTQVAGRAEELRSYQGKLDSSAATLLEALKLRDEIMTSVWKLYTYASLRQSEDATNDTYTALADRAASFASTMLAAGAYFDPEILSIEPAALDGFIASESDLSGFQHYFDELNLRREHTRSSEVESLLAQASDVTSGFSTVRGALENADLDLGTIADEHGNAVQLGQGNLGIYLQSSNREVRKTSWLSAADAYVNMKNTFAATLSGGMKRDVFYARAHHYDTALDAALQPGAVPNAVFHNLIGTVWKNLPTWHKYFAIRQRILGVDTLHEWDITAPLVADSHTIPLDQGVDMIADSLKPLGNAYVEVVRQGIVDRWVDPYANIGKHGGAFSGGSKGTYPFISMSYTDDFQSVSTLAHELGHSMHSYFANRAQPQIYTGYGMMVAETASNMHQALMGKKLLAEVDDPQFLTEIIEERMGNHLRYFFTMPILARFELECHTLIEQGGALTADGMTNLLADIYEEAYGGQVVVDRERMGITWARFPHLFAAYYVFNYAIGISAAAELSNQVLDEGASGAERYIDFLKAGGSKFQIDGLRDAGVDMTDPAPVQAAFDILASYVDRLDELTG